MSLAPGDKVLVAKTYTVPAHAKKDGTPVPEKTKTSIRVGILHKNYEDLGWQVKVFSKSGKTYDLELYFENEITKDGENPLFVKKL